MVKRIGTAKNNILAGTSLGDLLYGLAGNDILRGNAGNDTLVGGDGADQLFGGDGNDILVGGSGADKHIGGEGIDWAVYAGATTGVRVNLQTRTGSGGVAQGDTYNSIENVQGAQFAYVLIGDGGNNVLRGEGGADQIYGGAGSDFLIGGIGNDLLSDNDAASAADQDVFSPGAGIDRVFGDGNDTIDYSDLTTGVILELDPTRQMTGAGAAAGDTYTGILSANGSAGADQITSSSAGRAVIQGLGGNDVLTLKGASDSANGGEGNDTIKLLGDRQSGSGGAGNDTIDATGATNSRLFGGDGDDTLTGGFGGTVLVGGAGNDILRGHTSGVTTDIDVFAPGAGTDQVFGDGNDTIDYSDLTEGVILELDPTRQMTGAGAAAGDQCTGILNANGGAGSDQITSSSAGHATIQGLGGNDVLTLKGANDAASGGDGNDTITLLGDSQTGTGGAGNDTIDATGATNSKISGGDGDDTLIGGLGGAVIVGGAGNDILRGHTSGVTTDVDVFAPGIGVDHVYGDGNDLIDYTDMTEGVILELDPALEMTGAGAAAGDTYVGILSANGGAGADQITSSNAGHAVIRGLGGNDTLTLKGALDSANGGDGNDTIVLLAANQSAVGGAGDDILDASGAHAATLYGGIGADRLIGNSSAQDFYGLQYDLGVDSIVNFENGHSDFLVVRATEFGIAGIDNRLAEDNFVNSDTVAATLAGPQFIYDTVNHDIWFDKDGTGAAYQAVKLAHLEDGPATLQAGANGDFWVL